MHNEQVYEQASEVDAQHCVVLLNGPGMAQVRFTPDAAEETSERLSSGAMKARGQRYFARKRGDE
jgi:hypothetical protein